MTIGTMKSRVLGAVALAGVSLTGASAEQQQQAGATYTNPVLDTSFPDPTVIRVDKKLYAYGTGQVKGGNPDKYIVMSHTGTDLTQWSAPVEVMKLPNWASGAVWAPDIVQDPNDSKRFVMYFSAQSKNTQYGKCLGVAVSTTGAGGEFVALDRPLDETHACGKAYTNIDPDVFLDPKDGKRYLYWGSNHLPIHRMQISSDLTHLTGSKQEVLAPTHSGHTPKIYTDLVEGSWVVYRQKRYYIFTSGYDCCGVADGYAVVVWRSDSPTGPWTRYPGGKNGSILQANDHWAAPGHNGIFTDGKGDDWIIYHARHPGKAGRVLLYDRLDWSNADGWPRVVTDAAAGTPSVGAMPAPVPFQ